MANTFSLILVIANSGYGYRLDTRKNWFGAKKRQQKQAAQLKRKPTAGLDAATLAKSKNAAVVD